MANAIRTLRTLVPQETFGDVLLREGTFTEDDHLITRGFMKKQLVNTENKIFQDIYSVLPRKFREVIQTDTFIQKIIKDLATAADINDELFLKALIKALNGNDKDLLLALEKILIAFINSDDETKIAIEKCIIDILENKTDARKYLIEFIRMVLNDDREAVAILRNHMMYMVSSDADFREQIRLLLILLLSEDQETIDAYRRMLLDLITFDDDDFIFKDKLISMINTDSDTKDSLRNFAVTDKGIEAYILDLIKNYSEESEDPSHMLLTSDYDYTALDNFNNPLQIIYKDGQIVNITYREDNQIDYLITVGFKVKYNYNDKNQFIGITTTAINSTARRSNDTNEVLGVDYTYLNINENGDPISILYSDNQQVDLVYRDDDQLDYFITLGYKVTFHYDLENKFTGKTTSRRSSQADIDDDTSLMLSTDYKYNKIDNEGNPLQILFASDNIVDIVYNSKGLIDYYSLLNYVVQYNYDESSYFISKKTEKIANDNIIENLIFNDIIYKSVNNDNKPLIVSFRDGQEAKYIYYEDGRLNYIDTIGFRVEFQYNENNQFIGTYTYQLLLGANRDNDTNKVLPINDYRYILDNDGYPIMVIFDDGQEVNISYGEDGWLNYIETCGYRTSIYYDREGNFIGQVTNQIEIGADKSKDTNKVLKDDYAYTAYDENNNPIEISFIDGKKANLKYDELNNLIFYSIGDYSVRIIYNENKVFYRKITTVPNEECILPIDAVSRLLDRDYYLSIFSDNRPNRITFSDGQEVGITYREDYQIESVESVGFMMTYLYDNNQFIGISTLPIEDNASKDNDTNNIIYDSYKYKSFNEDGQPLEIEYDNGQVVNITYRSDGQINYYVTLGYIVTFIYDENNYYIGKFTEESGGNPEYDSKHLITPDFTITAFDINNRILQLIYSSDNSIANFVYRPDGQIMYYTYDDYRVTYKYNTENIFIGKKTSRISKSDTSDIPLSQDVSGYLSMSYTYNLLDSNNRPLEIEYDNGQIVSIVYYEDGRINYTETLGYKMTYQYNDNNIFIGIKTTLI